MLPGDIVGGVLLLMVIVLLSESAVENFSIPPNTGCACSGEILSYSCTAVGAGNSLWEGSAFVCTGNSIILRHSQFGVGVTRDCNGGVIVARSIEVNSGCYTSQLEVRVDPSFNNKSVNCSHDSTMGIKSIGSSTLIVPEAPYPPPGNVRLTDVQEGLITFSWNSLGPNCEFANYHIVADCGSCPNATNSTVVNCTDLQLSTEAKVCTFRVHVRLCGDDGILSDPVEVTLKLPDSPSVQFIPRFSEDTRQLTMFLAAVSQIVSYTIADGILGSVREYIVKITSNSMITLNSSFAPMPCVDINCKEFVSVPFQCLSSTDFSVTLSAVNKLGVGPPSDLTKIDCINNFVDVKYDSAASTLTCTFLDQPEDAASSRSCRVQYGDCLSKLTGLSNDTTTANDIVLNLQLSGSGQEYCYLVTASNGSNIVMVEGRISIPSGFPIAATVTIVLIVCAVIIALVVILLLVTFYKRRGYHVILNFYERRRYQNMRVAMRVPEEYLGHTPLNQFDVTAAENVKDTNELTVESRFNLKRINLNEVIFFKLNTSYPTELIILVESALKFKRSSAFYEFLYDEDISDVQEIIFVNEDGEYFYPDVDKATLLKEGLIGEDLKPPQFKDYRVFIQSRGSGKRYVPKDGMILYKHFLQMQKHPLIHVDASKFALRKVSSNCTLKDFCGICVPKANISSVYVELDCIEDINDILDVMLLDKGTDRIFTGTSALHMAKEHYDQSNSNTIDNRHWRIYVFKEFGEMFQLRKDMFVLYQIELTSHLPEPPNTDQPLQVIDKGNVEAKQLSVEDTKLSTEADDAKINMSTMQDSQLKEMADKGGVRAHQDTQKQRKPEQFYQSAKPPLIFVDSTPYFIRKIDEACTVEAFRVQHNLDVDVHNVFVESSRFPLNRLENAKILDVILEDKKNENMLYTYRAQWNVIKDYVENKHRWRAYILIELEEGFMLWIDTWVLYRATSQQTCGSSLMPIISKHFQRKTLDNECTFDDFRKAQPGRCNIFLGLDCVQKDKKIIDVVLIEKATKTLYSGPCAREMVKKHLSGAKNLDQDLWEAFVFCKFKSGLKLANKSVILCQDPDFIVQEFRTLKVEEDNVRMSEYIKQRLGVYEKGAAFYEFVQREDLLSYKEVLHVPKDVLKQENENQLGGPDPKDSPIDRSDQRGKGFNGHVGDFQLDKTGPHAEIRFKEPDGQQGLDGPGLKDNPVDRSDQGDKGSVGNVDLRDETGSHAEVGSKKNQGRDRQQEHIDSPDPKDSSIDRSDQRDKGSVGHVQELGVNDESGPLAEVGSKENQGPNELQGLEGDPGSKNSPIGMSAQGDNEHVELGFGNDTEPLVKENQGLNGPQGLVAASSNQEIQSPVNNEATDSQTKSPSPLQTIDEKGDANLKLESDTTFFYGITGAPGLEVKPPNIRGKRVFIQCTSQGSRCLKKGMLILYKVKHIKVNAQE